MLMQNHIQQILNSQQFDNKKKMEKGGSFKQGSMMDNIQKKKNMLKNLENY